MMDFDVPDNEECACALDVVQGRLGLQGQYDAAVDVSMAKQRLRLDQDEIIRLEARIAELERDRERLDYLLDDYVDDVFRDRAAIDAAMGKE